MNLHPRTIQQSRHRLLTPSDQERSSASPSTAALRQTEHPQRLYSRRRHCVAQKPSSTTSEFNPFRTAEAPDNQSQSLLKFRHCSDPHRISTSKDQAKKNMPFSAWIAEAFIPYDRVAPIRSTISVSGLISGYATNPSGPASGCSGSYRSQRSARIADHARHRNATRSSIRSSQIAAQRRH